jgi:hypothetical protein
MTRELRKQEVADAVKAYASKTGKEVSINDQGGFCVMPGDILVRCNDGKLDCNDPATKEAIAEILMEMPQEPTRGANLPAKSSGKVMSRSQAGSVPGSALDAVRECQATEKATYSTGKGRKAASAKTNVAALMEAGGSLEVIKRIHDIDYIEVVGRATLGNQHVDSSRSFYKQEYLAKKAWDWIVKLIMKDPGMVVGTDIYGMPEFREGAEIKVRISDDMESTLVSFPAKIALWREMAREWQAAGRVCETVAYSRASDMILRGDFQSNEEKAEEQSEVDAIKAKEVASQ